MSDTVFEIPSIKIDAPPFVQYGIDLHTIAQIAREEGIKLGDGTYYFPFAIRFPEPEGYAT